MGFLSRYYRIWCVISKGGALNIIYPWWQPFGAKAEARRQSVLGGHDYCELQIDWRDTTPHEPGIPYEIRPHRVVATFRRGEEG